MNFRAVRSFCFQIWVLLLILFSEGLLFSDENQPQVSEVHSEHGRITVTLPYDDGSVPSRLEFYNYSDSGLADQLSRSFNEGIGSREKQRKLIGNAFGGNFLDVPKQAGVLVYHGERGEDFRPGTERRFLVSGTTTSIDSFHSRPLIRLMYNDPERHPNWAIANGTNDPIVFEPDSFPFSQLVLSERFFPQMLSGVGRLNDEGTMFLAPFKHSGVVGDFGLSFDHNSREWLSDFAGIPLSPFVNTKGPIPGYMILPIGSSDDHQEQQLPKWMQLPNYYSDLTHEKRQSLNALVGQHFDTEKYLALLAISWRIKGHYRPISGAPSAARLSLPELYVVGAIKAVSETGSLVVQSASDMSTQPWQKLFGNRSPLLELPSHMYYVTANGKVSKVRFNLPSKSGRRR